MTPGTPEGFHPNTQGLAPEQHIPDALILQITTKVGEVVGDNQSTLVPLVDVDAIPAYVAEGSPLPDGDPATTHVEIRNSKVGIVVDVSEEQFYATNISELLSREVMRALQVKSNALLLRQAAPVSPAVQPVAGILAQGNQVATPIQDDLDALVWAIAAVESLPDGAATHILCDPLAWAQLSVLKKFVGDTDSNENLLGAGTLSTPKFLLGIPVTVTSAMPPLKLTVLDKKRLLATYSSIRTKVSDHVGFKSETLSIRASLRQGVKVNNSDAVQVLNVAAPAGEGVDPGEGEGE
ncbi:phage major capsid protein [Mycobacteroides abscessus]|uniref:phage major capsid protein n=1 Tax=Mycobacteroides abscessus TaxID=36809 RepID=UPI0013F65C07|nr:phage major capsid protein [Mycobacteroides abscessus]